jgi:hypothetical protein
MTALAVTDRESEIAVPTDINAGLLDIIARASRDPSVDIDKLERLLMLQERVIARDAESAFNRAMQAAQEEMPLVFRDGKNTTTSSTYAKLETVDAAMAPVIAKHGFSMSFGTGDSPLDNHYRVTCAVSHVGGHTRHYHADVPADTHGMKGTQNKTATHGFGSAVSYGRRYLKLLIFDVATTDDDGRAAGSQMVTEAQLAELQRVASEVHADLAKFCKFARVESLAEIKAVDFHKALAALKQKGKQ